jgi:hypothetical protein
MDHPPLQNEPFFLVRGGPLFRLLRASGIVASGTSGYLWRALLAAVVTWIPIAVSAFIGRRMFAGGIPEPLLAHFGIHARLLFALPLMILAEPYAEKIIAIAIARFRPAGLLEGVAPEAFAAALRPAERVRDSWLQWAGLVLAFAPAAALLRGGEAFGDELSWAMQQTSAFEFGGWWYTLVARPFFIVVAWLWLWRLLTIAVLMRSLAKLQLRFVPTHPDRNGGVGFVAWVPMAFAPFLLAIAAVIAARMGHDYLYHGIELKIIGMLVAAFLLIALPLCLLPALMWAPALVAMKKRARESYRDLVGAVGRAVHRRWVEREGFESDLLDAPGIGPVADANTMYEAVERIQPIPLRKGTVIPLVLAGLIPFVPIVAQEVPISELLKKLVGFIL